MNSVHFYLFYLLGNELLAFARCLVLIYCYHSIVKGFQKFLISVILKQTLSHSSAISCFPATTTVSSTAASSPSSDLHR